MKDILSRTDTKKIIEDFENNINNKDISGKFIVDKKGSYENSDFQYGLIWYPYDEILFTQLGSYYLEIAISLLETISHEQNKK